MSKNVTDRGYANIQQMLRQNTHLVAWIQNDTDCNVLWNVCFGYWI